MLTTGWTLGSVIRWGPVAALAGIALVLIGGRAWFWARHFLGRGLPGPVRDAAAASGRRIVLIELAASLAASCGLLGTLLNLRDATGGVPPVFVPALGGLGIFVLCQGALGIFRSWSEALRTEIPAAEPPRAARAAPPRARRPAAPPPPPSVRDSFRKAALASLCLAGSILLHASVFFLAQRVQAAPGPGREPERAGVFMARLVSAPPEPPAPVAEIREEPPKPPPPEPPTKKEEPPETPAPSERPRESPAAEKQKPEPSAPPPAAIAEAKEPEPKEAAPARPAAPPPPAKPTESAPVVKEPPAAEAPAPAPAAAVLGFGGPPTDRISTMKDYRQFLSREMKSGAPEGQYVPNLRFSDNKAQENREIMRYFGMELIAYPKNQKFYVTIDPDQGLFSRSSDFAFIRGFSSRAIFRTSPYFDALRAEAARRTDLAADSLVMAQLLKPSSAAYIGWKEAECARRAGLPLEAVEACDARFVKTPFGVWIVRIDRLLLKDGRTLPVEDFEWAKVSPAGGKE